MQKKEKENQKLAGSARFREVKQPAYEIEVCHKEPIMTKTPISIFINSAHVDSIFVDRLEANEEPLIELPVRC